MTNIRVGDADSRSKDVLGRVYEYFLGRFAALEGRGAGEFYTPTHIVRLLVEMLEPFKGRVFDPCCGSGGMFVQSERFVEEHGGTRTDISVLGQESNNTTWKLCKMNLAIRSIEADIRWNGEGSFLHDEFPDLKADFIMAPYGTGFNLATAPIFDKYGYPQIALAAVSSLGFRMMEQPAAMAGASLRTGLRIGKFHAQNAATWPIG